MPGVWLLTNTAAYENLLEGFNSADIWILEPRNSDFISLGVASR